MKLLVLTTRLFDTPTSGGEICTSRLLEGLRQAGHDLVLVGRGDAAAAAGWARLVVSLGELESPFGEQGAARRLQAVAGALLSRMAITAYRQGSRRVADIVAPLRQACDAVIVDHLQAWPWLGVRTEGPCQGPVMLVNHNVESDNYQRLSRAANRGYQGNPTTRPVTRFLMRREANKLRAMELQALQSAGVVACLSERDAQRLNELALRTGHRPAARLVVLPGYPLAPPRPADSRLSPHLSTSELPAIGLIGTWTWAPNREGLRWLLDRVWPALEGRARLVLAGGGLEGVVLPPGTQVLGRVADVGEFYDAVDVVAIVALSGSGVQEKAIEAIGSGLPVVATRHALRGLAQDLPPQVRAEDDARRFADACLNAPLVPAAAARTGAERWTAQRRADYARTLAACMAALADDKGPHKCRGLRPLAAAL
jgi:hypothetical protein